MMFLNFKKEGFEIYLVQYKMVVITRFQMRLFQSVCDFVCSNINALSSNHKASIYGSIIRSECVRVIAAISKQLTFLSIYFVNF